MKYGNLEIIINTIKTYHKTIINKINAQLQRILQAQYKKHEPNNTLHQFKGQFCVNESIAKIENNSLITKIINRLKRSYQEYCSASAEKKLPDANQSILFANLLH